MAVVPATALIPVPEKLTLRSGSFALGAATSIVADADLRVAAELLRDQLRPATGFPLAVVSSAKGSRIALSLDPAVGSLGDEGYRLAVTAGAFRKDSMTAPRTKDPALRKFAGKPHGGFYTQDDVREVVRYAADRGVAVIPEIEMPGHAMAAIAAYPELGNTGQPIEVLTTWGITDHVLGVTDNVLRFFEDVLEEVLELFPAKFIHIGGDECPKTEWHNTPSAQERMKKED